VSQRGPRRLPGELESQVLAALWAADSPRTATQVHTELGDDIAYTTVHTTLTRLYEKELVIRVTHAGRHAYAPVKDAAQDAADRMRAALESHRDRRETLSRFVTGLSRADERALRALLDPDQP
jgi:predicted transcriptional regulator